MIKRFTHKKLTWLDVINPTAEEIRELIDECGIPLEFTHDLTTMTPRTETFAKKGALKITLDFPIVKRTDIDHPHEMKFLVTKNHLVTIRFEDIEAMHRFGKEFEVFCMLGQKKTGSPTAITFFFSMLNALYASMDNKLAFIETRIKDIENGIFNDREKEMVLEISQVTRRLIDFRQTIGAHEKALEHLRKDVSEAFPGDYDDMLTELEHSYRHVNRGVYALMSTVEELRETNNSILTTKQNEVMKILTIMAFITFPLTLFTSTFGMNTESTPIIGKAGDFWYIIGIMGLVSISFFMFFRYKKWF